jgi:hypothetical protein
MDTISNLATAASKAIWGEGQHEEPVSGKMGNVAAGEPYDAGNIGMLTKTQSLSRSSYTRKSTNQPLSRRQRGRSQNNRHESHR